MIPAAAVGLLMDPMSLEDLALLDVLERIDQWQEPGHGGTYLRRRLLDSGLVLESDDGLRLTDAGIERCKSLHHRVAADEEAAAILRQRESELQAETPEVSAAT